jgi:hypothetical protein
MKVKRATAKRRLIDLLHNLGEAAFSLPERECARILGELTERSIVSVDLALAANAPRKGAKR